MNALHILLQLNTHGCTNRHVRAAFTAIELVAVLAVLSLAACLVAPAMARANSRGHGLHCLNNLRQLTLAWKMYAIECQDKLAPNMDGGNAGKASFSPSWAGGWLDSSSSTDNTNTALLLDHQQYPYGAYLGQFLRTPSVFRCLSDPSGRVRSYSMNDRVGTSIHPWQSSSAYFTYRTLSSIVSPRPSGLFVLVEERHDSINDPVFFIDPKTPGGIVDVPAGYHHASGAFGFADAHAELHRWQDPRTFPQSTPILLSSLTNSIDVPWLQQHAAARK